MNGNQLRVLVGGVVCAVALCGPRAGYAQGPKDPCSLVTAAQVGAAVGAKLGPGEVTAGSTVCQWATPSGDPAPVRVTLQFWGADAFAGMKMPLPGIVKTPLAGVGDDAIYTTVGRLTTLSVKGGKAAFVVRVYGVPDQAKQMAAEKTLALHVLAGL
jgi:hypothetical protein